jgi:hypothetical protein
MNHKNLLSAISLATIFALSSVIPCSAQETTYRYFEVAYQNMDEGELRALQSSLDSHEYMQLHANCPEKKQLLIAVDVQYPQRIESIRTEITALLKRSLKSKEPLEIETVSVSMKDQFCN